MPPVWDTHLTGLWVSGFLFGYALGLLKTFARRF